MTPRFRVLITDRAWPDVDVERAILADSGAEVIDSPRADEASLIALARDADAIGTCWAKVTENVLRAAPKCRIVSRFGIGLDNIAVAAATELGIPVTNVPDYCVDEVADHAMALILSCARKVAFFHLRTKRGEYQLQSGPPLRRLSETTLGLVGLGRIARNVYGKARALGMGVMAHTASGNDYGTGCPMVPFETLLAGSDFISLHAPLTDATRGMFRLRQFERMKRSAYLVNTSRGALIDADALQAALETGLVQGAALDVFDPEPPDLSKPLYRDERVLVTPHAAFLSEESLRELRTRAATQIAHALLGSRPEHVVNPEVYG